MTSKYDYEFNVDYGNVFNVKYYLAENTKIVNKRVFPPHVDDALEIYILLEGDASFSIENHVYKLSPMDVVITKPNQVHNCILNSNTSHKHACFWFKPDKSFLYKKFLEMKTQVISPTREDGLKLQEIIIKIGKLTTNSDDLTRFSLFISLIEIISNNVNLNTINEVIPNILKDILYDLNENFTTINSLDYLTKKYNVSSSTLNRLFNDNLQTSPKLFLETKRLAHSRKLLREGYSVMDACMKSGFPDYSNYIRLFKKRFNITPNQYKNQK
ncbi:MAG: helix-turn-helix domain-containing protein [Clostridiales bacterium]|nr:helix-turn-helix domain-containing protein [Clostridiales bacterium]